MHDWTKVTAGIYHHFHQQWVATIANALNAGRLPTGYYAMVEQVAGLGTPDVLALSTIPVSDEPWTTASDDGGLALAEAPPRAAVMDYATEMGFYAKKKNRVVIHRSDDRVVGFVELVSPGNKSSEKAMKQFVDKVSDAVLGGIHVLLIDPFPPGSFDPNGLHGTVWPECGGEATPAPADRPLTLASYQANDDTEFDGYTPAAYVEPTAVGRSLIDMPLFFAPGRYVNVPLEETYTTAFGNVPKRWRDVIESLPPSR